MEHKIIKIVLMLLFHCIVYGTMSMLIFDKPIIYGLLVGVLAYACIEFGEYLRRQLYS